jgi:hypothetical protein
MKILVAGQYRCGTNGNADGSAVTAQFNIINDMVGDSQWNLYVTDENRIRKVSFQ